MLKSVVYFPASFQAVHWVNDYFHVTVSLQDGTKLSTSIVSTTPQHSWPAMSRLEFLEISTKFLDISTHFLNNSRKFLEISKKFLEISRKVLEMFKFLRFS